MVPEGRMSAGLLLLKELDITLAGICRDEVNNGSD